MQMFPQNNSLLNQKNEPFSIVIFKTKKHYQSNAVTHDFEVASHSKMAVHHAPKKAPGTGKNGLTDFFSALDVSRALKKSPSMLLNRRKAKQNR